MTTSLLPVPRSPMTFQESSTIVQSPRGSTKWRTSGGVTAVPDSSATIPPRMIQPAWSVPVE